jgi:hypothetical protein
MQHANTCKGKCKKYSDVFWLNSVNQPALLKLNDACLAQKTAGSWESWLDGLVVLLSVSQSLSLELVL